MTLIRNTVKATLTHFQHNGGRRSPVEGRHADREGRARRHTNHPDRRAGSSTTTVDPFRPSPAIPPFPAAQFVTFALFATDTATLGDRLTINAGVRYNHNRAYTQDLPLSIADGRNRRHHPGTWDDVHVEPDLTPPGGVTTKLTADGRTILRASYGRFHQGILTAEVGPTHPGITPVTTMAFDAATGGYTRLVSVVDSTLNVQVDPHMRRR